MDLLQRFKSELHNLGVTENQKVLIAVSGGLDSMVLLDLSRKSGLKILAAHVNYHKRGESSLQDEQLVRDYCAKHDLKFESKSAELSLGESNDGFQGEARKVRYTWFEELSLKDDIDLIFTAHHLNDRIETLFINLLRGAGLKGLKSIPRIKGRIRRPLLSFERKELEEYARTNKVPWRHDESNFSEEYLRNKIRHGLVKEYMDLSARAEQNAGKAMDFLAEADSYFQELAKRRIAQFKVQDGVLEIRDEEWNQLFKEKPIHKYVFEKLGFYPEQLNLLEHFGQSQSGKKIEGRTSLVYRDRERFLIRALEDSDHKVFHIVSPEGEISSPLKMRWELIKNANESDLKNPNLGYLNLSKLTFPLTLRPWAEGDKFQPFGMKGSKKLSDFFTDIKLSAIEKEKVYVLVSDSEIAWVVGLRVSDKFAVKSGDMSIIKFELDA
jgi:tRNA(Ile)-lysidine synthase